MYVCNRNRIQRNASIAMLLPESKCSGVSDSEDFQMLKFTENCVSQNPFSIADKNRTGGANTQIGARYVFQDIQCRRGDVPNCNDVFQVHV